LFVLLLIISILTGFGCAVRFGIFILLPWPIGVKFVLCI
jgi:hypothetical protein